MKKTKDGVGFITKNIICLFVFLSMVSGCKSDIVSTGNENNAKNDLLVNNKAVKIDGNVLSNELVSTNKTEYDTENPVFKKISSNKAIGSLNLYGTGFDVENNIIVANESSENDIIISYNKEKYKTETIDDDWFIASDKGKCINKIEFDEKIKHGALIIEVSRNGEAWTVVKKETDVFDEKISEDKLSYKINLLQIQNNTKFRVTIAYQLRKLESTEKTFLGIRSNKTYSYSKNIETYEFSISNNTTANISSETSPRREYREVIAIEKDEAFSKEKQITYEKDNPQYNENDRLGYFVVNGYSGNPEKSINGNFIYTKNAGDDITLWFCFNKNVTDIFDLKNDGNLKINDSKKTYDKDLHTSETDFHHGALFIKFTNTEGTPSVIEYYDFLRAVASPLADTKVRIYEEGEYEVTLDYEIKKGSKEYDYKMNFSFEVKNGNCMVFFRDKETTSEISNLALAKSGFTVDFAGSKDLEVSFQRNTLIVGANGTLGTDAKENKSVNDFDSFDKEGIYEFTIHNKHTNQTVYKKIYVGNNKYYKALSKNAIEITDLNAYISSGAKILDDGTITKE